MYTKSKLLLILSLFLLTMFTTITIPPTQAQVSATLIRQRVQYGYWEIVPVIDNILTDWSVASGHYDKSKSGSQAIDEGTIVWTYKDEIKRNPWKINARNYIIDPDGNTYNEAEGRDAAKFAESLLVANPLPPRPSGYPSDAPWTWKEAEKFGYAPYAPSQQSYTTQIYRGCPPVGFSVGNVYLSDPFGIHWSDANNGAYPNTSAAIDALADWEVIPNYARNTTYIYREIPYSMKVCFWTQGYSDIPDQQPSEQFLLQGFFHQDSWGREAWGIGAPYWVPSKSAYAKFFWVNESYIDADPVTANLNLKVMAPLWTARATDIIRSPSGDYLALYNDTWVGFLDARITNIYGGLVDPLVPAPPTGYSPGNIQGVSTAPPPSVGDAPTQDYTKTVGSRTEKVTPTPSQAGVDAKDTYSPTQPTGVSSSFASSTTFSPEELVAIQDNTVVGRANDIPQEGDGQAFTGFPEVVEGNIVLDPNYYEPYWLAASLAQGAALGNTQDVYLLEWSNQSFAGLAALTNGIGDLQYINYLNAQANFVNHTAILSDITGTDRQYAEDLALDRDMPNVLDISLGATMKPAVHTWFKNIRWIYKEFGDQVWNYGDRHTQLRSKADNIIQVLAGQELLNVFMIFTITFTVVVVDRYNHEFVPGVNKYAGKDLIPWIKMQLHNNTYTETYEWSEVFFGWSGLFPQTFWLLFLVFVGYFLFYRAYNERKYAREKFGKTLGWLDAMKKVGIIRSIIYAFVLAFLVQLIINIFTGGFPWFFFF